ncbi:MAG: nickel-dependent lactate racemase [Bacteroidota bacterium]|nr:nickel-dependent lactate racemase [Bacteroidota bacterium]
MEHSLKYGNQDISFPVPGNTHFIRAYPPDKKPDKNIFLEKLSALINSEIHSAGIVVADKTRVCEYPKYLPWLIELLNRKGLNKNTIRFYIAYGIHPRQTGEESLNSYGDTFNKYEFVHHDCDDVKSMTYLGRTSRGTTVRVRKDIFEHDLLILFGPVSHHYFAGYGGGRKLLFPGLAKRESIYLNHKLFIDFDNMKLQPGCRSGKLTDNPVAEDLYEIDKLMPDKIIISGIPDANGNICSLMTGTSYENFLTACKVYDNHYRKASEITYDNVIASAGGYPKDINFIQTHKSLHNAASFVKDGGNLFLLGECRDGLGNNEFLDILKGSKKEISNNLKKKYSGNGGTALSLLSKTKRINVYMVSGLESSICDTLNIKKIRVDDFSKKTGRFKGNTAIIENASLVYC